jgi:Flp pilus assembly CpaF family ATPase
MQNYGMFNMPPQVNIDRINNQIRELEDLKTQYQSMQNQQQPVNNINVSQQVPQNSQSLYEMKVLNDNDEVENIFVNNNAIFIGNDKMQIKKLDGTIEKYEIKKIYPVDKKDLKIQELEKELNKLKEAMANEYTKPIEPIITSEQSSFNADGIDKSTTTKSSKSTTK